MQSTAFADPALMARITARALLEIGAVNFRADEPYTLTSGMKSPVYIDCRSLISYPRLRSTLMDFAVSTLFRNVGLEQFDTIAGGETAGIPFSAWIADRMELPMNYVRKKPKGFGRDAQIEGAPVDGKRVLLVEDLTTDGGSKFRFVDAIRKAGGSCDHIFVLFFYDIFPQTLPALTKHGVELHALATWKDVLAEARTQALFDTETLNQVEAFLGDPLSWSGARGGVSELGIPGGEG